MTNTKKNPKLKVDATRDETTDVAELRTANTKHYRNGNGTYSAVIFDSPVHYLDETDNTYKEIDMSLVEAKTKAFDGYKVKSNKFGVKFAKSSGAGSLMIMEDSDGTIDISCGGLKNAARRAASAGAVAKLEYTDKKVSARKIPQVQNAAATFSAATAGRLAPTAQKTKSIIERRLAKLKRISSNIMYENAFGGADLEYVLSPDKIKENIIVGARADAYEYTFTIKLDGFDLAPATDGGMNIVSKKNGEVKYKIPAPFMYDATAARSEAVTLVSEKISDGVFELGIVADKVWINAPEREFPVVIDPQIVSTATSDIIMNSYSDGVLIPSTDNLNALGRCYGTLYDMKVEIHTPNIVSKAFSNDTRMLNATIELSKAYDTRKADSLGFNVLKDGRVIDHFTYNGVNNRVDINITNELNAAIRGKVESSVFDIRAVDRESVEDDYMLILNATDGNPEFRPKIMIDYVSDRLSLGASCHKSEVKRAGVGEVNLFNGDLKFTHTDIAASGNGLPFDIKHIYMSKLKGKEYDCEMFGDTEQRLTPDFKMGKGWKLNIQQHLLKDEKDATTATYLDGNGEVQLFEEKYFYEENGIRTFVKKEQCFENPDGSLSVNVTGGGTKPVTKALLTESGLLLFLNAEGKMVKLSEDDTPLQIAYEITYKGSKEKVNVLKGNKCVFTRYYNTYSKDFYYNGHHNVGVFHRYYSSSSVTLNDEGKYCLKGSPNSIVQQETKEYSVHNDNGRLYINILEPVTHTYYAGTIEYMSAQRYYLTSDKKDDKIIFGTDEIMSLYKAIAEIDSYITDYRETDARYASTANKLEASLDSDEPIEQISEQEIREAKAKYNKLLSEYENVQIKNNVSLREKQEQRAELAKECTSVQIEHSELARVISEKSSNNLADLEDLLGKVVIDDTGALITPTVREEKLYNKINNLSQQIADLDYAATIEKLESDADLENRAQHINQLKLYLDKCDELQKLQDRQEQLTEIRQERERIAEKIQNLTATAEELYKQIDFLINKEKLKPLDYIVDDGGNRSGFDFYGRLVEVSDKNDNKTTIEYDGDDIAKVTTRDGKAIRFEYYLGRLNKIFDTRERMTLFEYNNNGFLSKIVYPDNQAVSLDDTYDNRITEFGYNEFNELEEARDLSGYAVKYTYNYFKQVETVREYTYAKAISGDGIVWADAPILGDGVTVRYNNFRSTSVISDSGVATTYVFDNAGRAVNVYRDDGAADEDKLNVTDSVSLSYKGRRKAYNVSVSQTAKNYALNHGFENGVAEWTDETDEATAHCSVTDAAFVGGQTALKIDGNPQQPRYAKQVILAEALPSGRNLIFAAWAKASSAFIRSDRSSGYGDDRFENFNIDSFDEYKRNRKFGIRAVIKYEGYEPETMETTFDWYNTAWQFTSLPIRLLKDRTLESITLYLDYTNNINSVLFDNVLLIEGEGEYKEFYEDGKLRYSTDGKIDSFYPEYYNGMPVREIKVDEDGNKFLNEYAYDQNKRLVRVVDNDGLVTEYTYNESGEIVKTEKYHKADPCTKFVTETTFDGQGKVTGELDARGTVGGETLSTRYKYIDGTDMVKTKTNTADAETEYGYDYATDKLTGISETDDGEDNKNLFEYTKGYLTRVHNDSASFEYGYDGFGRNTTVKLNGETYATYDYEQTDDGGEIKTATLANGETVTETTDKFGNRTELTFKDEAMPESITLISQTFDENNRQTSFTDGLTGETHEFGYDDRGRVKTESFTRDGVLIQSEAEYDGKDNVTGSCLKIGDETMKYAYASDKALEPKPISATMPDGTVSKYEYDLLGRKTATVTEDGEGKTISRQNTYYVKHGDHATAMPSSERFGMGDCLDEQTKYRYDKAGNISEVYKNGILTNRYAYDKLNRMTREDNKALGKTMAYTYDTNGNILTKVMYAFTLGSLEEKTPLIVIPYSYKANGRRDQMTKYNGEKSEYDGMGNPTTYRDRKTTFKYGGRMIAMGDNTYAYDAMGERLSKTVNGVETRFIAASGKVVRSVTNGVITDFYYDNYGLSVIKHDGKTFYVRKNVLGDITHIYDAEGKLQTRYEYDAWGNHKVLKADGTEDEDASSIGNVNPIRYRGYFFDTETGLYFLKARYYDPETGRFISQDDTQFLDPNTVNGLNLYAYCGNNPVMNVDPSGNWSWQEFGNVLATIGSAIVGILAVAGGIALSIISFGAAIPGVVAFGLAVFSSALMGMGSAIMSNINSQLHTNGWGNVDLGKTWTAGGFGFIGGAITGAISFGVGEVAKGIGKAFGYLLSTTKIGGLLVSKVFSSSFLSKAMSILFESVGGFGATMFGNYIGNDIFNLSSGDLTKNTIGSTVFSWLLRAGTWLFNL